MVGGGKSERKTLMTDQKNEDAHRDAFVKTYLQNRIETALVAHAVGRVAELAREAKSPAEFAIQLTALGRALMIETNAGPKPVKINGTLIAAGDQVNIVNADAPGKAGKK
jgi:hypothetical protein